MENKNPLLNGMDRGLQKKRNVNKKRGISMELIIRDLADNKQLDSQSFPVFVPRIGEELRYYSTVGTVTKVVWDFDSEIVTVYVKE
jgi:hypothetical protein